MSKSFSWHVNNSVFTVIPPTHGSQYKCLILYQIFLERANPLPCFLLFLWERREKGSANFYCQ
jgi:hypothetical protein